MHNYSNILVITGSLCLIITLGLSWYLVGVRSSAFMKKLLPNYQYLLKAHIDYLLMTGLLMIFFLLFSNFRTPPSAFIAFPMCIGSLMNPVGFLLLAMKPSQHPASPFGMVMASSFTLTTIGYAGAAWSVGYAAIFLL